MDPVLVKGGAAAIVLFAIVVALTPVHPVPDFMADKTLPAAARRAASASGTAGGARAPYRLTLWRELAPPNWNRTPPVASEDIARLDDSDPRARELLDRMRSAWDEAPPNPALNGTAIRTAGFVVPIEDSRDGMREFLLVPYYGACIHIPPPPANQIIDVSVAKPVKGLGSMDSVWVKGVLRVARTTHDSGASTYAMSADSVEAYEEPSR